VRRLADGLAILTGWALFLYCFAVGVEILGRKYFGFSLQGVDEIGGYLMALIVAVGFTCALYADAHIRIDILLPRLPRTLTLWLNAATQATLIGFAFFLVWQGSDVLAASYRMKAVAPTPLQTPLAVPQAIWVAGLVLFLFAAIACFVRDVRIALRKSFP
jgi:TRAP-type C4-dicarboxylate transport system permease small subunit